MEDNVSEGIYVEFKREFPSPQSIAKSIASFSNTYGGYFFIGIAEEDITNIAQSQIGVDTNEYSQPKETIRNIARDHLDPTPDFSIRAIQREDYPDFVILILEIPKSNTAPHVRSDGKIYVRTGEASNPIEPATDRWSIDQLYERRNGWKETVNEYCSIDIEPRGSRPILELFCAPSTLGNPVCNDIIEDLERFETLVRDRSFEVPVTTGSGETVLKNGRDRHTRFESFRSTSEGVVAQAWIGQPSPNNHPTMFIFLSDGGLKIHHPVPTGNFESRIEEALNESVETPWRTVTMINGTLLLPQFYRMMKVYLNLLEEADWFTDTNRELELKAQFRSLAGTAVGFDYEQYYEYIENHGPPLNYEDLIEVPRYQTKNISSLELKDESNPSIFEFSAQLMEGLGLPYNRFIDLVRTENRPIGVFNEEGLTD